MKKIIRLVVLVAILGILTGGYIIYSNYQDKNNSEDNGETDKTVQMLKIDTGSIHLIEYEYDNEHILLEKTDELWQWSEDNDFPVDQTVAGEMADALADISASRLISENSMNDEQFGLSYPQFSVSFSTISGEKYEYCIGDYNSVAGGYYAKISSRDSVYLVPQNAIQPFSYKILDMIQSEKLPDFQADSIVKAEYKLGSNEKYVTTDPAGADFYSKLYSYFSENKDGKVIAVDGIAGAEFFNAVADIKLGDVDCFKPDTDKIDKFGLSENDRLELYVIYKNNSDNVDPEEANESVNDSFIIYIGRHTNDDGSTDYYVMPGNSCIMYRLEGGEQLYKTIEADFESKYVCPVSNKEAISFTTELKDTGKVNSFNIVDIEKDEKVSEIFNKITSLVYTRRDNNAQKKNLVFSAIFDVGEKELILNVYMYDGKNYVASFDTFDNMVIPADKIDQIINSIEEYK